MFMFVFLPVVMAVYFVLPGKFRNAFLLVADLVFYGWGEPVLVVLMLFSILINYFSGLLIGRVAGNAHAKKAVLAVSVIINLGLLGFFKYAGFISDNLQIILPFVNIPIVSVPLPIGISFYTFQTMSYTIDVYRGDSAVQRNAVDFGTYVSLFPQLIAGPIVRYSDVEKQLKGRRENLPQFARGVRLFVLGLAKKVLLANPMGKVWGSMLQAQDGGVLASWVGIIAFTFQIYYDFSGYSDMARGLGNMFGFEFLKNFDYPYISRSITEFWRRWHISLGTWFREYVYIPLGGNRKGRGRTLINLLIVWLLTGFWHGASWNFVIWGLYFGVILILEKTFLLKLLDKLPRFASHIYSLFLIVFGWVIFYFSDDVGGVTAMAGFVRRLFGGGLISADALSMLFSCLPLLFIAAVASTPLIRRLYDRLSIKRGFAVIESAAVAILLVICTASLVSDSYNPFLYFKF